ncbi:MAG: hypothetical protein WDN30_10785 [Pararobbsia sp.]
MRRVADGREAGRWMRWHEAAAKPATVNPDQAGGWRYADGPAATAVESPRGVSVMRVAERVPAESSAPDAASAHPALSDADRDRYDELAYQAFLESGDVASAMRLAQRRVNAEPASPVWQRRLAQSAEWSNQPSIALQAWLANAKQTHAPDAWVEVLRIAPALNDDEAYVEALLHQSDQNPADIKLLAAVVDAYERLGRPEDALAFLKRRENRQPARRGDAPLCGARRARRPGRCRPGDLRRTAAPRGARTWTIRCRSRISTTRTATMPGRSRRCRPRCPAPSRPTRRSGAPICTARAPAAER